MQTKKKLLSSEQNQLIAGLVEDFGIQPTEITFFSDDPKPHIGYEATCVMCNALVPSLKGISIDQERSVAEDSLTLKCTLTFADGRVRSAIGVANVNESGEGGEVMSDQQLHYVASSRAIRNALRTAGIDLIKIYRNPGNVSEFTGSKNRDILVRQVHALGEEVGYIDGDNKSAWRLFLLNRYGANSASLLSEDQLSDLAAALKPLLPRRKAA